MDATRESISGERVGDDALKWTVFISDNSNSESRGIYPHSSLFFLDGQDVDRMGLLILFDHGSNGVAASLNLKDAALVEQRSGDAHVERPAVAQHSVNLDFQDFFAGWGIHWQKSD